MINGEYSYIFYIYILFFVGKLESICREYYSRIAKLEDNKYDLEFDVRQKDFIINELNIQVNDLRGKLYV